MVALPEVKKVADCDTGGGGVLIPDGQYKALIVKSEMVQTKDKKGQFLALTVLITAGDHKGTELTERLNLVNKNPKAVEIAYGTLAKISKALGRTETPADSTELHNKPLMIDVKSKKGQPWTNDDGVEQEGTEQSEIKKYHAVPTAGVEETTSPATEEEAAPAETAKAEAKPPAGGNPFAKK